MKIIEKDDEIILRDIPLTNWIYGVIFLLGSILFAVSPIINAGQASVDFGQIIPLGIAVAALYWSYLKFSAPIITTRIRPNERMVDVTSRRFLLKKTESVYFSQIKYFEMVRRKPDRAYLYFSVMTLSDGSQIDLESTGNPTSKINRIPTKLNELLKKHKSQPTESNPKRNKVQKIR